MPANTNGAYVLFWPVSVLTDEVSSHEFPAFNPWHGGNSLSGHRATSLPYTCNKGGYLMWSYTVTRILRDNWTEGSIRATRVHIQSPGVKKYKNYYLGFEVFTAVVMKSMIFWDVTPCSLLRCNRRFGGTSTLQHQGRRKKFSKKPASKQGASSGMFPRNVGCVSTD
jgi:hypothetical protein